jgi:PhoH-like ATPase
MRICVCDTSSLINCSNNLEGISADRIIIPLPAYEELDDLSHSNRSSVARQAKQCIRYIETMQSKQGSATITMRNGAVLEIVDMPRSIDAPEALAQDKVDNRILGVALSIDRDESDEVVLLTDDAALRTKARYFGITAQGIANDSQDRYMGWSEHTMSCARIDKFYEQGSLKTRLHLQPNEFVILKGRESPKQSALARYDAAQGLLVPLRYSKARPWGISPRNVQQTFLMEALLDPDISVVSVPSPAGTGKTLMSIACGGHLIDSTKYDRMSILKPLYVIGPDIGYLPGSMDDKLAPHMESIYDALDFIFSNKPSRDGVAPWEYMIDKGKLELQSITHMRGRSIPGSYIIVDEAQNLTPLHVKTIITRCGQGTKIVLTGDPHQIDNHALSYTNNGLMHVTDRFVGQECFATITLTKTERSALAELGAQLL